MQRPRECKSGPAYEGRLDRFRREVVHVRPGVFVLFDDRKAPKPARFQWLLHAYHRIAVDNATRMLRIENDPAAMNVHLLLPEKVSFTQTDRYEPEPESVACHWENTWHLSADTVLPAERAVFLAVLLPHRKGREGGQGYFHFHGCSG